MTPISRLGPPFFFWLGMAYTVLLLVVAAVYIFGCPVHGPYLIGGVLPIAVPWFGAIGAVTISLEGVFMWNDRWNPTYNYWHIGRPLFGAVLGIVAFFLFVAIITAAGTPPRFLDGDNPAGAAGAAPKDFIIFYVVAFLVGYREETFRDLIKRATDLILKPGTTDAGAAAATPSLTFQVAGAPIDRVVLPQGPNSVVTVQVDNNSAIPLSAPSITLALAAGTPSGVISLANDQVTNQGDLAPGQIKSVDVVFTPPAPAVPPALRNFSATLTVAAANLPTPKSIGVSGQG